MLAAVHPRPVPRPLVLLKTSPALFSMEMTAPFAVSSSNATE